MCPAISRWSKSTVQAETDGAKCSTRIRGNYPRSIAQAALARVRFYDLNNRLLLDMQGRWADSTQPSVRNFRESITDLLRMDFGINEEHSLDIVFRDTDGRFVAWNNDNYNYPDMRKPEHVLIGDAFAVEVQLSAAWVDETYRFQFSAAGSQGIAITVASSYPFCAGFPKTHETAG
jgi:hypothetical protein